MPNHELPIEQATLWDIIDIRVMRRLVSTAPAESDTHLDNPRHAEARFAKEVVEGIVNESDEEVFLGLVMRCWIGSGDDLTQRRKAGRVANLCGARSSRLIAYLNYKRGLFRRNYRS